MRLNGFYRGVVEDNNDPLKVGRVRARIFGLHTEKNIRGAKEGILTEHLPWVEPCLPIAEGSISGYGIFSVPLQGSHVMIFFENGSLSKPHYFASLPGVTSERAQRDGFNDPDGVYPDKMGSDFHSKAKSKYPHNMVISVHGGHYIEIDSSPGDERIKVYHKSGTSTEINKDGKEITTIVDDQEVSITGDTDTTVGGNVTVTIGGNADITATGIINVTATQINLN